MIELSSEQTPARAKTTPSRTTSPPFVQKVSRQLCRKAAITRLIESPVSAHPLHFPPPAAPLSGMTDKTRTPITKYLRLPDRAAHYTGGVSLAERLCAR